MNEDLLINIADKEISFRLLNKILKNLSINDLIKCRYISKKFKSCVDQIELNELIIKYHEPSKPDFVPKKWWFTQDNINENNLIKVKKFENNTFNLNNLKRLFVFKQERKDSISIKILNSLVNLEQLDIDSIKISYMFNNLFLKKLKYLNINRIDSSYGLIIDTPNLISLRHWQLEAIKLKNNSKLKYLETQLLDKSFLKENKNIENIEINVDIHDESCAETLDLLLESLSNLRKLKCLNIITDEIRFNYIFKKIINQFLDEKLKRINLSIKIDGIEIENIDQLGESKKRKIKFF